MSKAKGFLKALFGTESSLEIARKIITIIIILVFAIPSTSSLMTANIKKIVKEETAPINNYIYDDIAKLIYKSVDKINETPNDVKIVDIETSLNNWEAILKNADINNKAVLEQKIVILQKWYLINNGNGS